MRVDHVFTGSQTFYAFRATVPSELVPACLKEGTEERDRLRRMAGKLARDLADLRFNSFTVHGPSVEHHKGYRMPLPGGGQDFLPEIPNTEYLIIFVTIGPLTPWD